MCDSWDCEMQTVKDVKNEAVNEYVKEVVEELEALMQDLNVVEIISHIDFDSTIQSSLNSFLKSFSNKAIEIVKQGGVSDDVRGKR